MNAAPVLDQDLQKKLRQETAACRIHIKRFGVWKSLTSDQLETAANTFGADSASVRSSKKLLDTRSETMVALTAVFYKARHFWKCVTIPYPEPGWRLIRRDRVQAFDEQMAVFQAELDQAKEKLRDSYNVLRDAAKERLGELFNPADYPTNITDLFSLDWDFPSIEPPEYLKQLNPSLYEAQCQRLSAKLEEAVNMAEQGFVEEMAELVSHLCTRLETGEDGKQKVFRDTAVTKMVDFFDRFKSLNVRDNEMFQKLVNDAQQLVKGVSPETLRKDVTLRGTLREGLASIRGQLDAMLVDKPKRSIILEDEVENSPSGDEAGDVQRIAS